VVILRGLLLFLMFVGKDDGVRDVVWWLELGRVQCKSGTCIDCCSWRGEGRGAFGVQDHTGSCCTLPDQH
jgi:hypothetical protein